MTTLRRKQFYKITVGLLTILAVIMIGVNVVFDLRYYAKPYYRFIAAPTTVMEWIVNQIQPTNGRGVNQAVYSVGSLVDLPYTAKETNQGKEYVHSMKRDIHQVSWYNKPSWISTAENNRAIVNCPYSNCKFVSGNSKELMINSSALIFTLQQEGMGYGPPVLTNQRNADQVWIYFTLEAPVYIGKVHYRHRLWEGTMNWSMGYRTDADIVYTYGALETRKTPLSRDYGAIYRQKTEFAAWIVSNCGALSRRDDYVRELQQHGIPIHVYGFCGQKLDQPMQILVEKYKFYLSFENSLCTDYITEKFFKYFQMETVLVVRGGADYNKLLPSNSFINTADFSDSFELSQFLLKVNSSEEMYVNYLKNRDKYDVKRQMLTQPICILCEKLNHKDVYSKTYDDLISYVYRDVCHDAIDIAHTQEFKYHLVLALLILTILVLLFSTQHKQKHAIYYNINRCLLKVNMYCCTKFRPRIYLYYRRVLARSRR